MAAHDVGLGIFGTTAKALTVVPTKVFQAAAAGCAVVTSDTAPQRDSLRDAAVFVPPGDAAALASALVALAADPAWVRPARERRPEPARPSELPRRTAVSAPLLELPARPDRRGAR